MFDDVSVRVLQITHVAMFQHSVLMVDDDPRMRRAFGRTIKAAGYDFREAESLSAAVEVFRTWSEIACAVILLDLRFDNGGNGADLLPMITTLHPQPAVAVLSGYIDNEVTVRLFSLCTVLVTKPIEGNTLLELIESLGRRAHADEKAKEASRSEDCSSVEVVVQRFSNRERLSPQEGHLVMSAVDGLSKKQAAVRLGCEEGTVSSYWKRVFRKTGRNSQRDVISSILRYAVGDQKV